MNSIFSVAPLSFDPEQTLPIMDSIIERLRQARAVQVIGHLRPDGDCLGSLVAAHCMLSQWGKPHALAARDSPKINPYAELAGFNLVKTAPDPALDADLIWYVDCATADRGMPGLPDARPVVNIDHHGSNTLYGTINWIEPRCAAAGEMLFYLAERAGLEITASMAEALLVAISTDTGGFRFANAGPTQLRIAARLLECGASNVRVNRAAYGNRPKEALKLTGRVLDAIRVECDGRLAWSELRRADFEACGGEAMAPENLANLLREVRGVSVGILFSEGADDSMRINLRSDGAVDVCALAAEFGGGGHKVSSGVTLAHAQYERDRDAILARARAMVATAPAAPE